jgi:predicted MPP superfamily phosphohydrolase
MKKLAIIILVTWFSIVLSSCKAYEITYTDDLPFEIEMKTNAVNILQITDLHLTYGIDKRDRDTFDLIKALNDADDYDLIVITGDLTMSPQGPRIFSRLIDFMESLETPWTFVFGNHETDFNDYDEYLRRIPETEYLLFKVGPKLDRGGYGNFSIVFNQNGIPFYKLYLLDSKAEIKPIEGIEDDYDYLSFAQVNWYESHVQQDTVDSIVFMHIPLRQYILAENYVGTFREKRVYAQSVDTGFFDAMVYHGRSKAVFVGHDHLNDFYFYLSGILLAYGRATGYNGYGDLEKGGRYIRIDASGTLETGIISGSEVRS